MYQSVSRRQAEAAIGLLFPDTSPAQLDEFWDWAGGNDFGMVNYVRLLQKLDNATNDGDPRSDEVAAGDRSAPWIELGAATGKFDMYPYVHPDVST